MKNIGLIGCGNIAETYFRAQDYFNNIKFIACADKFPEVSKKCADQYNIKSLTVDEILNDTNVDVILNLTIPQAHFEISKLALEAGKHVYSEKPMSIKYDEANELVNLAKDNNLYIGNAPDTFLGGGGQVARQLIDKGEVVNTLFDRNLDMMDDYFEEEDDSKKERFDNFKSNPEKIKKGKKKIEMSILDNS